MALASVIACNNDGVWNEAGAAVEFSILPTFYQTSWFLVLCIASTLTVLYLLYYSGYDRSRSKYGVAWKRVWRRGTG
jgi:hypothetical protein